MVKLAWPRRSDHTSCSIMFGIGDANSLAGDARAGDIIPEAGKNEEMEGLLLNGCDAYAGDAGSGVGGPAMVGDCSGDAWTEVGAETPGPSTKRGGSSGVWAMSRSRSMLLQTSSCRMSRNSSARSIFSQLS